MQNEMMQNADMNGVGYLLGMLWVFGFMALVLVAYIGRRTNERRTQTIGFELEVIKTLQAHSEDANHSLANFITKVRSRGGFKAYFEGYNHDTRQTTKLVTDASLSTGGIEVVSPPLSGSKVRQWLTDTTKALAGLVTINRSCGVHVHVGLKNPDETWGHDGCMDYNTARRVVAKTALIYALFQEAINTIMPPSRRGNRYAQSQEWAIPAAMTYLERKDGEDPWLNLFSHLDSEGRYYVVNTTSLRKYGTVEFRQHGGSINAVKLDAWSQLCGVMVARAATIADDEWQPMFTAHGRRPAPYTVTDLANFLGLSTRTSLVRYFKKRANQLAGISISPCESCASSNCAGCENTPANRWSDVPSWTVPEPLEYETYADAYDDGYFMECNTCGSQDLTHLVIRHAADNARSVAHCEDCEWTEAIVYQHGSGSERHAVSLYGLGLLVLAMTQPLAVAALVTIGCGIGALHSRGKQFNNERTAASLWTALEDRGRQAAGVGWVDDESVKGKSFSWFYHKKPHAASEQVGVIKRLLSKRTRFAMFHTRFATHGANNEDNAHPHFSSCNRIMLVHNGVVGNSDTVWEALGRKPTGPVDSQAVAECLAVGGIQEVIKHCVGTMSLIWADSRDPVGTLHFWTNGGNPLHFGRLDNPSGDIMVASTETLWLESAGKRAITEPKQVQATRQVKTKGKYGLNAYRTELVVDKKGRPVMKTIQQPTHNWAAIVGKHYTISPEGEVSGYMTENHEDTVRSGGAYDWRSYGGGQYIPRGALPKPVKATGNADNCSLPSGRTIATQGDLDAIFDHCDKDGGWPPFKGDLGQMLHGYDAVRHEGINPEGQRYALLNIIQPWIDEIDRKELLQGDLEDELDTWQGLGFGL